jgi:hypothetical protein
VRPKPYPVVVLEYIVAQCLEMTLDELGVQVAAQ